MTPLPDQSGRLDRITAPGMRHTLVTLRIPLDLPRTPRPLTVHQLLELVETHPRTTVKSQLKDTIWYPNVKWYLHILQLHAQLGDDRSGPAFAHHRRDRARTGNTPRTLAANLFSQTSSKVGP